MHINFNHYFFTSAENVKQICKPLQSISVDYFSYTRSYPDGRRIYLITFPEWLHNYFERDFHLIGNCELKPKLYQNPRTYLWSSLPNQIIYNEAREFGIQDGLFLIRPCKEYTEFFEFSTLNRQINMPNVFFNNYEFLKNFKDYFVLHAEKLIKHAKNTGLILPHNKEKKILKGDLKTAPVPENLLYLPIKLSARQHQCAVRLLQGKSQKVIAKEMKLSPRTVETYLNNLKLRFGVATKTELIIKLLTC